jgi:predicted metal-dependent HD superfamily phosphohydrolase
MCRSLLTLDHMTDLLASWKRSWKGLGATGDGSTIYDALVARYSEPHRQYHTIQHLAECLDAFSRVAGLAEHPAEVELAVWFHDAIYDVERPDNEERSALWARSELTSHGVNSQKADYVHSLIMVTKHSVLPVTQDQKILVDIDLSILGASEARFEEYERQIRAEFAFVPASLYVRKRRVVLESFLARSTIYNTEYFVNSLEQRARANLRRAIGRLRPDASS